MKIAYIYYTDHDLKSAHNNQIIHTCNALSRSHTVTVLSAGGIKNYADEHGLEILFDTHETNFVSRIPIRIINRFWYYLVAVWLSRSHDVIYTRDISFLKFLAVVPDFTVPPLVFEAHKSYSVIGGMSSEEERRRLNRADGVVTLSDGIRSDIEELGVTVDAIVPDAANTDYVPSASKEDIRRELGIDQDSTVFVYAGSLAQSKYDMKIVVKAFASVSLEEDSVLYILGGEPQNIDELKEHASSVGAEDRVHLLGHRPQYEVFRYLKAADVGIVAQQPTDVRASKYTSPLKLFEYLICGLVVVATDVPSIAEVADDEPRILTYNPDRISDIERKLEGAATKENMNSDDLMERYGYGRRADLILSVLEEYV